MILSSDFLEKVLLLVIASFIVPFVLKFIDDRRSRRQKEADAAKLKEQKIFEADLTRQGKIIEAQSKFLDDVTEMLWQWRYLAKRVVYYGTHNDIDGYTLAKNEYQRDKWPLLNKIRGEVSRSRRLVSENAYRELLQFYNFISDTDVEITRLTKTAVLNNEWRAEATRLSALFSPGVSTKVDTILELLANELHLKFKEPAPKKSGAS